MAQTKTLPLPSYVEHRRAPRVDVSFRASLRRADASVRVHVVDISPLGLCARWDKCDAAGIVEIKLPVVGYVKARIAWALGGRIGAEFVDPIDPAAYRRLLAEAPQQSPWHD